MGAIHERDYNDWAGFGQERFSGSRNEAGGHVTRKRLRRGQMLTFFAGLPPCLVGMEPCVTAHYWARELRALGHYRQPLSRLGQPTLAN